MEEKQWYEKPIKVREVSHIMTCFVENGENGGTTYPERHYWPRTPRPTVVFGQHMLDMTITSETIERMQSIIDNTPIAERCYNHRPTQHGDAKPPWCPNCGLTSDFQIPVSSLKGAL